MGKTKKIIRKGDPWTRFKNQLKDVLFNPFNLMTLLAFIVLIVFVVVPLLSLVKETFVLDATAARRAKAEEGTWSIYFWQYLLTGKMAKSMFWTPLVHSLTVSFFACLVAVPLGAILAWLMVRSDIPGKKIISFLIVIAYMMPSWCKAQAWLSIFRNALGGTPGILYWLGWQVPDWIAYGPFAMVCVLALHYYAFTYIMLAGSLGSINSELEEMALIQGASKKTIVMKITLPLVMPAFLSATIMTFSKAIGGYSVASYLGTRVQYHTLSTRLHDQIASGMPGVGYAISILMILISAALILVNNQVIGTRKSYSTINGKGGRSVDLMLGKWRIPMFLFVCLFLLIALIVPVLSLVIESLQVTPLNGLAPDNFTLFNWIGKEEDSYALINWEPGLFRNVKFTSAIWNTVKLGVLGAIISSFMGQIFGYISVRGRGKWYGHAIDQLVFVPYLIPAVAFSAVYVAMFIKPKLGGLIPSLYGTFTLILLISTVKYFPYASKSGTATMIQIAAELEEAASINGAGFFRRFARIIFPLAKNGFMSGFILTFISIAKEFDLISLVVNERNITLSYLTFTYTSLNCYQLAACSSVVMIALISVMYLIAKKVFGADIVKSWS
ncbi:MAG: iron ABC transporter permease [Clostridia bacterium]|nr:iron ABC transporter permease [Clostridia bacterium]